MEGKTDMPDQSFCLLLLHEIPHVKVIEIVGAPLAEIVEQIEIKVSRSRLL